MVHEFKSARVDEEDEKKKRRGIRMPTGFVIR